MYWVNSAKQRTLSSGLVPGSRAIFARPSIGSQPKLSSLSLSAWLFLFGVPSFLPPVFARPLGRPMLIVVTHLDPKCKSKVEKDRFRLRCSLGFRFDGCQIVFAV